MSAYRVVLQALREAGPVASSQLKKLRHLECTVDVTRELTRLRVLGLAGRTGGSSRGGAPPLWYVTDKGLAYLDGVLAIVPRPRTPGNREGIEARAPRFGNTWLAPLRMGAELQEHLAAQRAQCCVACGQPRREYDPERMVRRWSRILWPGVPEGIQGIREDTATATHEA